MENVSEIWCQGRAPRIELRRALIKTGLIISGSIWVADIIYRIVADISYVNREQCVLFRVLPRSGFLIYEYFFETLIMVFVGTFIAVLVGRQFLKLRRFMPRNPVTAFAYGSIIPVCSCVAIPLLSSLKGRLRFSTTMSFVLAAPLLSPYIIVLSFSVLGLWYGLLRIASSFVLVMACAAVLGAFGRRLPDAGLCPLAGGCAKGCAGTGGDIYLEAFALFKGLLPYLLLAGVMGIVLEYVGPRQFLLWRSFGLGPLGVLIWILIGVPLYFCNGAEVLFLRPLLSHGFPVGTAIAFSLTSTVICTTSISMLFKVIGTRLTVVLITSVICISLAMAVVLNSL
jgi:uncharacterized membrane protein YraQ (UPF0718 family)